MDKIANDGLIIKRIVTRIKCRRDALLNSQVTIGFDGFIDSITRVIEKENNYFNSIGDFARYLLEKEGSSCTVELQEIRKKFGGNMPIIANALGVMGIRVNCIGALGDFRINPIFKDMSSNCRLLSFAEPGYTSALEFNNGKVMLARMATLNSITWEDLKETIGLENITELYRDSRLIGMVNWSEMKYATDIWQGIFDEVLIRLPVRERTILFDLSDCSKRSLAEVNGVLELIRSFGCRYRVILSMNENEASVVAKDLAVQEGNTGLVTLGEKLYNKLELENLVLHNARCAVLWNDQGYYRAETFFIKEPRLLTGGGDNFNAGLFLAEILSLDNKASLVLANALAHYYIHYGCSPDLNQLLKCLMSLFTIVGGEYNEEN